MSTSTTNDTGSASAGARRFPDGFLWGTATASYQIEGAAETDDRGPSIWDTFSRRPGAVFNGDTGDVSCDHYNRWEADLDLLADLGVSAYRFSVAWPRILPAGGGSVNERGLDFYRRLVDGLRERGVVPVLTLYHWDLPQPLEDAGGWVVRDTATRFADYAGVVAEALGDRVGLWITLNEPWCSAWLGYASGHHAPGRTDLGAAVAATHHLLVAHGLAMEAVRASVPDAQVGITLNLAPVTAASDDPADVAAARRVDGNLNRIFTEPLFEGRYPDDVVAHHEAHRPGLSVVAAGDLDIINRPVDFLGVNFYSPQVVAATGRLDAARAAGFAAEPPGSSVLGDDLGAVSLHRPGVAVTAMGWEVDPASYTQLLVGLRARYGPVPIYLTENGAAYADYVDPDGAVHDPDRIAYVRSHLHAVADAIEAGVDVRGYFVWSFLDNFEWAFGYSRRFGITWVDYPTGARLPKDSFAWYRQVATSNLVPVT